MQRSIDSQLKIIDSDCNTSNKEEISKVLNEMTGAGGSQISSINDGQIDANDNI